MACWNLINMHSGPNSTDQQCFCMCGSQHKACRFQLALHCSQQDQFPIGNPTLKWERVLLDDR